MAKYENKTKENTKDSTFDSHTLLLNRVAKVVKGGKKMKFQAVVAIGDRNGRVAVALGKGRDPKYAIEKATTKAKKKLLHLNLNGQTIPFDIMQKFKSSKIFFKPAKPGTGIIASNSIRPILELAGIKDIYTKIYGTNNKLTNAYCVIKAFEKLNS